MFGNCSANLPYRTMQWPVAKCWCKASHALWRLLRAPSLAFRACRFGGPGCVFLLVGRRRMLLTAADVDLRSFRGKCLLGESKGCRETLLQCAGSLDKSTAWRVIRMLFHLRR